MFLLVRFADIWQTFVHSDQGRIQDFKLGGGGALKFFFWGISCEKSRLGDFTQKNHIFSNFRGAPESAPGDDLLLM